MASSSTVNTSAPQVAGKGKQLCEAMELCQALNRAFGGPFSVWFHGNGWKRILSAETDDDPAISQILAEHFRASELNLVPRHDGGRLVISPVVDRDRAWLAVCGVVGAAEAKVVPHFVAAKMLNIDLSRKLADAGAQLDSYACQVTSDFEELTWLRGLAEHIDVCDPTHEPTTVAEAMLPTLRELIQAEAIGYFPQAAPVDPAAPPCEPPAHYVAGALTVSESCCRSLIEHLETSARRQPAVRNADSRDRHLAGFPGVRNCILVRVAKGARLYGWLLAINKRTDGETGQEAALRADSLSEWEFGTFEAGLASAAVVMLAAHARGAELFREKEAMLIGVIRALINAIDAKDTYTCGHSDRVALIAKRLAEQMGFDRPECERIYMAGLLHDVGKIGVPDEVLTKPGKLTDEEFALIKKHPEIGHSILSHVAQLSYVLPGVLHHHEAVDGRGYPHNLAGDNIPLHGRILAVADAYDAMTSTRPYRTAMPTEKAESILREGAGKQWDAGVIEAFFSALSTIRDIRGTDAEHTQALIRSMQAAGANIGAPLDSISAAVGSIATGV